MLGSEIPKQSILLRKRNAIIGYAISVSVCSNWWAFLTPKQSAENFNAKQVWRTTYRLPLIQCNATILLSQHNTSQYSNGSRVSVMMWKRLALKIFAHEGSPMKSFAHDGSPMKSFAHEGSPMKVRLWKSSPMKSSPMKRFALLKAHKNRARFDDATRIFNFHCHCFNFNVNIFQLFLNFWKHITNLNYLVCISCKFFLHWRFCLLLKTNKTRRVV